jgi:signal transduction histidine kinase
MRAHPRLVDAGLALLIAAVNAPMALRGAGVAAVLCYFVVHAPLIWRRVAPALVFWLVSGLAIVTAVSVGIHVEGLYPEMAIVVAVYTVARHSPRRHLVPIVAAVEAPAVVAFAVADRHWTTLGFVTAVLAATVLTGTVVRIRLAYTAELVERARRLERERDQQAEIATAAERSRIARDMHDIVAHNLTVMVALADGAALTATTAPEQAGAAMRQVSTTGRQALTEMRRVLGLLHSAPGPQPAPGDGGRAPQPGLGDLDGLVGGVRAAGLPVALTIDGEPGPLGPGAELAVYRIVQEALTNTLKHAGTTAKAHVRISYRDDRVDLDVTDDGGHAWVAPPATGAASATGAAGAIGAIGGGIGATSAIGAAGAIGATSAIGTTGAGGHGMAGMAQRAAAYGGTLSAGPRPGGPGWRVHAVLCPGAAEPARTEARG